MMKYKSGMSSKWSSYALLGLVVYGCLILPLGASHQAKNVNVAVRAKWAGTPLLLEACELVAQQGDQLFWQFIDLWLNSAQQLDDPSDEDCVKRIVKDATSLLGGQLSSFFHFSLLLRSLSPKIVLYRQLARESLLVYFRADEVHDQNGTTTSVGAERWILSENPPGPRKKCCWVDVGTQIILEEQELVEWLLSTSERLPAVGKGGDLYDFDHIFPGSNVEGFVAILYGALGTPCFAMFHSILVKASQEGLVRYSFRPVLSSGCEFSVERCARVGSGSVMNLGGFGVELALKNMEYKAIDDSEVKKGDSFDEARSDDLSQEVRGFIFSKLLERKPELAGELMTFRDQLLSSGVSDTLNVWELKDLGYQTAQRIIRASEPLRLMQEINQNFPNLVSSLSRMQLNETIKEEIVANQRMLPPGKNLFAINGALVNPDTVDLFSLLDLVKGELSLAEKIAKVKVPAQYIRKLLQITEAADAAVVRVDYRSKEHVHYLNNLEEDFMYRRWRNNLNELLMPLYPGQLRYIRKNLFHAVYLIDPGLSSGLKIANTIMLLYQNNIPIRFGVIFFSSKVVEGIEIQSAQADIEVNEYDDDVSSLVIRLFLYVKRHFDVQTAFGFLNLVDESQGEDGGQDDDLVQSSYVETAFVDVLRSKGKAAAQSVLQELMSGNDFKDDVLKSTLFVYKLGLHHLHPCLLMNGLVYGESQAQQAAISAMNDELPKIQEGVYYGTINSRTDILDKFLSEHGRPRYNPQIVASGNDESRFVSLAAPISEKAVVLSRLQYLHYPGTEDAVKPITHLICVDLSTSMGMTILSQGLRYLVEGSKRSRIGILHTTKISTSSATYDLFLTRVVISVANSPSRRAKILPFLQRLLGLKDIINAGPITQEPTMQLVLTIAEEMGLKTNELRRSLLDAAYRQAADEQIIEECKFLSQIFDIRPGSNAVITNGRVFVQKDGKHFLAEDFTLLDSIEYERRIKSVEAIVESIEWKDIEPDELTSEFLSSIIMAVSSSTASRPRTSETARFDALKVEQSGIVREADKSSLHIEAVIDPLSVTGQKLTPLLVLLQDWFQPSMRIVLNPMNSLADLPLKNFYRYVAPSKDNYFTSGALTSGSVGIFSNMPQSRTLTMNLDVPEPWLVEPVIAIHDLDNIVLEKLTNVRTMSAVYELEALVLTGHCHERDGDPPRGLQLLLGTKARRHIVDTIVMANLGYWQLKAAPGLWMLRLAPGRSSELYTLRGLGEGTDNGPVTRQVVIQDLKGELVRFEVVKRKGKENQKVLDFDTVDDSAKSITQREKRKRDSKGFLHWATGILGTRSSQHGIVPNLIFGTKNVTREGEPINIFSIASGHLYERFLKIMMLSVLKNTGRPVKFWFIKNYLSPQFKDVIPHMASEYGFEYDLVTYKWPSWLHKQTEKQRIIWAYKILFLDVLFPLSLKKVIFVDADQIVRADMGELYDMDLKGRPLAYTPFCENNKEMDGYRFWSQGFWKDHLRGRPYHISALYVVDLIKFRQSAAGDNLRVFYESLSKDPNSLSNLDQDLPNYAQHTVPIFSLPQEWLWCESWCGNATKSMAKTIDLCNNPMTKEPKLEGARRIVAEWPALDEEARQITEKVLGTASNDLESHPSAVEVVTTGIEHPEEAVEELWEEIADDVDVESKSEL